jgi:A/G-specific adenine glycosylase
MAATAVILRKTRRPAPALTDTSVTSASEAAVPFRRALLRWYDFQKRDLPWRRTRDPYLIWLSEIMLQQTRVAAVLEHYRKFLERFPTVQALAAATEDEVLSAWSGLGYYRRARMLHRGAIEVVEKFQGNLPRSRDGLLELPGIGRYTASAIASIAFSEAVAVVDGNVERVLRRIARDDLSSTETWELAQTLLMKSRPGDSNQAMMELGAVICLPRAPKCLACPVKKWCATRGESPRQQPRFKQHKKELWCILQERFEPSGSDVTGAAICQVRLIQRSRNLSLMAGMWELPQSSTVPRPFPAAARWRTFRHCITVSDYTVHVLRDTAAARSKPFFTAPRGKWIAADEIPNMPITGLTGKILKAAGVI